MKALVVVDVQRDFLPGGALGVPHGDEVVPEVLRLMQSNYGVIVTTQDLHPEQTKHFDRWPPHCVRGTPGAELDPLVAEQADVARERGVQVFHIAKGQGTEDDGYSGFEGTTLDGRSLADVFATVAMSTCRECGQPWDAAIHHAATVAAGEGHGYQPQHLELHVVGLATDYCVKATAIDAAQGADYATTVLLGGCRGVDPETTADAIATMRGAGAVVLPPCWNCRGSGIGCCEFGRDPSRA